MVMRFLTGMRYLSRGARFVYCEHRGLVRFWIVPVVLTLAAVFGAFYCALTYGSQLALEWWAAPQAEGIGGTLLFLVHSLYRWLLILGLAAFGVVISVALSTIIASPFNDALSREVERLVSGDAAPPGAAAVPLLRDLARAVWLEVAKLLVYGATMAPLLLVGIWVPAVGSVVTSPAALLLSMSFLAIDYVDWPAARRNWPVRRRLSLLRRDTAQMLGFGLGVWVAMLVPLLNLMFMPAAVAGGTLMFLAMTKERQDCSE